MKRADIEVGKVYAYKEGKWASSIPIVVLDKSGYSKTPNSYYTTTPVAIKESSGGRGLLIANAQDKQPLDRTQVFAKILSGEGYYGIPQKIIEPWEVTEIRTEKKRKEQEATESARKAEAAAL